MLTTTPQAHKWKTGKLSKDRLVRVQSSNVSNNNFQSSVNDIVNYRKTIGLYSDVAKRLVCIQMLQNDWSVFRCCKTIGLYSDVAKRLVCIQMLQNDWSVFRCCSIKKNKTGTHDFILGRVHRMIKKSGKRGKIEYRNIIDLNENDKNIDITRCCYVQEI